MKSIILYPIYISLSISLKKLFKDIIHLLEYPIAFGDDHKISLLGVIIVIVTFFATKYLLKITTTLLSKRLTEDNKLKFNSLFVFLKYFIYALVGIIIFQEIGISLTPLLAASTALLVGVGLALQTLFQDIISGMFILIDESIKVRDIIEFDNKVVKVEEIKLRTTRAVTIDNKMLIIPNHHFLTNSLYNWTQNNKETNDSISIGVSYTSDVNLVRDLLKQAVSENSNVLSKFESYVFFEDFGDNALLFRVRYSINNVFSAPITKSEIRFRINELFNQHNISIPFPQRDVHIISQVEKGA